MKTKKEEITSNLIKLFKIINALVGVLGLLHGVYGMVSNERRKLQKKLNNSEKRELNFQKELSMLETMLLN